MRITLKSVALAALTATRFFSALPGWAESVHGTYKAIACDGANSLFERAQGTDRNYDIGNTKMKSVLIVGSNDQTAAVQVFYAYTPTLPPGFRSLLVNFRDDGQTRNKVKVQFCFQRPGGGVAGFDRKLTDFKITPTGTKDWDFGLISAADLGFEPDNNISLVKVVFSLEHAGNIQIGDTKIGARGQTLAQNNTIDLSEVGPCKFVHNCKDVDPDAN